MTNKQIEFFQKIALAFGIITIVILIIANIKTWL